MKSSTRLEFGFGFGCFLILVFFLREPLIFGRTTFAHDNFYWNLPVFHFYAESLLNGNLPLWNPFSQSGEPFYPALMQIRLLDPLNLLSVFIGGIFTKNILLIYHWNRIFQSLFMLCGVYSNLRSVAKNLLVRTVLLTILFFSSFMLGSFHADGVINNFLWAPWIFYFFNKIFNQKELGLKNFAGLAFSLGVNFQSYFFAFPCLLIILLSIYYLVFRLAETWRVLKSKRAISGIVVSTLILLMMSAPNLVLWSEQGRFVFPARLLPENYTMVPKKFGNPAYQGGASEKIDPVKLPYSAIEYGGSFSSVWDYVQVISPESNAWIYSFPAQLKKSFGQPSECFLYFGILGYGLILFGLFFGKHEYKRSLFALCLFFVFLSLGPSGRLHQLIFNFFPPLWFIRHLQFSVLFVSSGLIYFLVLGANQLLVRNESETINKFKNKIYQVIIILILHFVGICLFHPRPEMFALHFFLAVFVFWILGFSRKFSGILVVTALTIELFINFVGARALYAGVKTDGSPLGQKWLLEKANPIMERELYPEYPPIRLWGSQRPRYLGNLYRQGFVFSRVQRIPIEERKFDLLSRQNWWDALYVSKDYFESVNGGLLSAEKLAIGSPIYQMEFSTNLKTRSYQHNHIVLDVDSSIDQKLYWRESYDPYWKVMRDGIEIQLERSDSALKAFQLSKGKQEIVLKYWPKPFLLATLSFYLAVGVSLSIICNFARFLRLQNILCYPMGVFQKDMG